MQRLKIFWSRLRQGLWFLPLLLSLASVLLNWQALRVSDKDLRDLPVFSWLLHDAGAKHGHELLSNLLSSMITMTSLVISLTMVVLTLAIRQLGPRLMGYFMSSTITQTTLGIFIGTIVYLLLTLRVIHEHMPEDSVPHFAITLGSVLSLLSIFMLLFFIHHLARSIVADQVIYRIGGMLERELKTYANRYAQISSAPPMSLERSALLRLNRSGYVQVIDYDTLVRVLEKYDGSLILDIRPGEHIIAGTVHGSFSPLALAGDAALLQSLQRTVEIGDEPVAGQDVEFGVRQLVEVALRALSSGESDPYTAIRVIDRLGAALIHALPLRQEIHSISDQKGIVRLSIRLSHFEGLLNAAFNEIRQSSDQPDIAIRLLETLFKITTLADPGQYACLLSQGEAIWQAILQKKPQSHDLMQIQIRYKRLMELMEKDQKEYREY